MGTLEYFRGRLSNSPSTDSDAADPAATLDVDIDGDARSQGAGHDMGADEAG